MDIISRPDDYREKYAPFLERMSAEGFVVEDDVQEMDIIREEFDRKRNSGQYTLMVLPTYDCNLRCWYCIQEHQNMTLSDETVARIKKRIEKYLSLGVDRCILGSVAVPDFDFTARMLKRYGERIAVGVDAKDGFVAIHGWKEVSAEKGVDFCRRLADAGCTAIIYTDIACDGAMQGTNLALYRQLATEVPGVAFTASGGISSEAELLELKKMGTAAAILGKSLYTGALDLKHCVELVQN